MRPLRMPPSHARQQGGTLFEVLIAILIFCFGILGLIGLQANLTRAASEAKYRAEAGYIAQQELGRMWTSQNWSVQNGGGGLNGFNVYNKDISATSGLPNGRLTVKTGTGTCLSNAKCEKAKVIVSWQQPDGEIHQVTFVSHISGG